MDVNQAASLQPPDEMASKSIHQERKHNCRLSLEAGLCNPALSHEPAAPETSNKGTFRADVYTEAGGSREKA